MQRSDLYAITMFLLLGGILVVLLFLLAFGGRVNFSDSIPSFSLGDLNGNYQATMNGFIQPNISTSEILVFHSNGMGRISNGSRVLNREGEIFRQSFDCTYGIQTNGTGELTCVYSDGSSASFAITLVSPGEFYLVGTNPNRLSFGKALRQTKP